MLIKPNLNQAKIRPGDYEKALWFMNRSGFD